MAFLESIQFIDRSNEDRFYVRDVSVGNGPKIITDASDHARLARIKKLDHQERERLFRGFHADLSQNEINFLLGRRQALEEFERQLLWGSGRKRAGRTSSRGRAGSSGTASTTGLCGSSTAKWSSAQGARTIAELCSKCHQRLAALGFAP
ncbi:hypothetical protein IE4872_CH02959 [Rhizobium gallicum]|uniref:Uncharacterized protein n=1 Tax=Rhizobium gallicum TaxID=56730 RepID=A0A1L5NKY7_9HYPH|nr:hypothetical protein [Rhizobium gallicum]APO68561.1 hypothetical protein IE4872_CH02959 [Rhizobium gallicum]